MNTKPAKPAVELHGVSVRRGAKEVLRDINISVEPGRVVGLVGPSGCGKTTLMRTIVGVQANVKGTVNVLGRPAGVASSRGQVGYMTQDGSVYGDLTVLENLSYFSKILGIGTDRIDAVLESVSLSKLAGSLVDDLSGGQRARVSLAVALLSEPALLVLDEPTVGLDPVLRTELWHEFTQLALQGTTLVISSHVMDEARRCDSLILMRDGQVLAEGSPADLMTRTNTESVELAFLDIVARRADH